MDITRRTFLQGTAAGVAYAALPAIALPSSSTGPLAEVFHPPGQNIFFGEFIIDFERRSIRYDGNTMFSAKDMYTKLKGYWHDLEEFTPFEFPMIGITPDYFIFEAGYYLEEESYVWMNGGALFDPVRETKFVSVVGLGNHDAPVTVIQNGQLEGVEKVDPWKHVLKLTPDIKEVRWYATGYDLDISNPTMFQHKQVVREFSSKQHLGFGNLYDVSGPVYYPTFFDQTPPS